MLKRFRKNSGQSIGAELVMTFVVVIVTIVLMSTYVRRAMQGRVRDSMVYARDEVTNVLGDGNVLLQYEPYYVNSAAQTVQDSSDTIRIDVDANWVKNTSQGRTVESNSIQLAPKDWY